MSPDVLVLGGGVIGLSVARALALRGDTVALVSDGQPGASAAAAGMLCPSFEAMQTGGRALAEMGRESLALWDDFAGALSGGDPGGLGYDRSGVVGVGYPPGRLRGQALAPPDGVEAATAVLVPGEGQVDPRLLLSALEADCDRLGVRRVKSRVASLMESKGRTLGARTSSGVELAAEVTVLATGAGLVHPGSQLRGVRGRALLVPNVIGLTHVLRSPGVYLAPKPGNTLYVGATEEEPGETRDGAAALDGLWSEAVWLVPALSGAKPLARFDGRRPALPGELPSVGADPARRGLVLALGHHRNGVLLAPLTAERVASAI